MITIIEFLIKIFSYLPADPFTEYLQKLDDTLSQYLGYINWIIPVKEIYTITLAWVGVILSAKVFLMIYNIVVKKVTA